MTKAHVRLGEIFELKKDFQKAVLCYKNAFDLDSNDPQILSAYVSLFYRLEKYEEIVAIDDQNEFELNNIDTIMQIGESYMIVKSTLKENSTVKKSYTKKMNEYFMMAAYKSKDNLEILLKVSRFYLFDKAYTKVIKVLSLVDEDKANFEVFYNLGFSFFQINNQESATIFAEKAKALNPHEPRIIFLTALILRGKGLINRALENLEQLERAESKDPNIYLLMADLLRANGELKRAKEALLVDLTESEHSRPQQQKDQIQTDRFGHRTGKHDEQLHAQHLKSLLFSNNETI